MPRLTRPSQVFYVCYVKQLVIINCHCYYYFRAANFLQPKYSMQLLIIEQKYCSPALAELSSLAFDTSLATACLISLATANKVGQLPSSLACPSPSVSILLLPLTPCVYPNYSHFAENSAFYPNFNFLAKNYLLLFNNVNCKKITYS